MTVIGDEIYARKSFDELIDVEAKFLQRMKLKVMRRFFLSPQ